MLVAILVAATGVAVDGVAARALPLSGGVTPIAVTTDYNSWHRYPGAVPDVDNPDLFLSGNPGRIWTDKTVLSQDDVTGPDAAHELTLADDELGVVLSALGTTRQVLSTRKPVIDLVLVLDNSYSMRQCVETDATCANTSTVSAASYRNSRAYAMVEGVNAAIEYILSADPSARISLVAFGTDAQTLTPLQTPARVGGTGDFVEFVAPTSNNGPMYLRTVNGDLRIGQTSTGGAQSTNIHRGIDQGMSVLTAQATSSVAGDEQHIPSMIVFSDGEPTYSANESRWWSLSGTLNQGPGSPTPNQYYGNGFLAALSAAFGKNEVTDVYNDEVYNAQHGFSPVGMNVYTVGLGVTGLSVQGEQLARATLDPLTTLPDSGATNPTNAMATSFAQAMTTYTTSPSGQVSVVVNAGSGTSSLFTVNRPSGTVTNGAGTVSAITYNPTFDQLRYNTTFDAPNTAADLVEVFERIASQVLANEAVLPVETTTPDPNTDGYVTFTDTLGAYMHVSAMDHIVFCSLLDTAAAAAECEPQEFGVESVVDGPGANESTYVFEGSYQANDLFPQTPLSNIIVRVQRSTSLQVGDVVTVRIPVALLPMVNSTIVEDAGGTPTSMTWHVSHPVHLFFKVAPKPGVAAALSNPYALDSTDRQQLESYVMQNTAPDGTLRFYSDAYDADSGTALTTATFRPSSRNDFYRFARDSILYVNDSTGQKTPLSWVDWLTIDPSAEIYRLVYEYRVPSGVQGAAPIKTALYLPTNRATLEQGVTSTASIVNVGGLAVAQAGLYNLAPRVNTLDMPKCADADVRWEGGVLSCEVVNPASNRTDTAAYARQTSVMTSVAQSVQIRLGNNGWLEYNVPGAFDIAKTVTTAQGGLTPNPDQVFSFTVTLEDSGGEPLPGDFDYVVIDASDDSVVGDGTVTNGGTIGITAGQYARVLGLPNGAQFAAAEQPTLPAYATTPPSPAGGTIAVPQEQIPRLEWTNEYSVTSVQVATPSVLKQLQPWVDGTYSFTMCPEPAAPPLDDATQADGCVVASVTDQAEPVVDFGTVTFPSPGEFTYRIAELPTAVPGVADSLAQYEWRVVVSDDGVGQLTATSTLTRVRDDAGGTTDEDVDGPAAFVNTWEFDTLDRGLSVVKREEDSSTGGVPRLPVIPYQFTFALVEDDATTPAPRFVVDGVDDQTTVSVTHAAGEPFATSAPLRYTTDHVGHTYFYEAREDGNPPMTGLTLSTAVWFYRVDVLGVPEDGRLRIDPQVTVCETTAAATSTSPPWGDCAPADGDYHAPGEDEPLFVNAYDPAPVTAALSATKALQGRPWAASDRFDFTLVAADAATEDAIANDWIQGPFSGSPAALSAFVDGTTAAADPNVVFATMTFLRQGVYQFDVTEDTASLPPGVQAVASSLRYIVSVTDAPDGGVLDGQLDVSVTSPGGTTVTNEFSADATYAGMSIAKTLTGRDVVAGEFEFEVAALDAGSRDKLGWTAFTQTFTNTSGGASGLEVPVAQLPAIVFTQDDLGSTFAYEFRETDSGAGGVTYDPTVYTVTLEPQVDAAAGQIWVLTTVSDGVTSRTLDSRVDGAPLILFENTYAAGPGTAVIDVNKRIVGRDWRAGDAFTFQIAPRDGAPAPTPDTVTLTPSSDVLDPGSRTGQFAPITFTSPGTYVYDIREIQAVSNDGTGGALFDDSGRVITVTVEVVDDGSGTLRTAVTGDDAQFENLYRVAYHVDVLKRLTGRAMDDGEFAVHIEPQSEDAAALAGIPLGGVDMPWGAAADGGFALIQHTVDPLLQDGNFDQEYCYVYSEVPPATPQPGVTYDDSRFEVCVTFHEAVNGSIEMSSVVSDADTGDVLQEFTAADTELPMLFPQVTFQNSFSSWALTKTSSPATGSTVQPGDEVTYTLTVDNRASTPLVGALAIDDISQLAPYVTFGTLPAGLTRVGDTLQWSVPEVPGTASASVSYTVTVNDDATGATLRNVVAAGGQTVAPEDCEEAGCRETEVFTPSWTLTKSSDPVSGSTIPPGTQVTYTLTATNTSDAVLSGALAVDDLSEVLAHATLGALPAGLTLAGEILTWAVPDLAPGDPASISYTVTVDADATGVTLRNVVTGGGAVPAPEDCDGCRETELFTPGWTLVKEADPPGGTTVARGDTITYTLTAINTSDVELRGAVVRDDLTRVLASGTLGPLAPGLSRAGTTLVWAVPDVPARSGVSVSYAVTVTADGVTLVNAAWGEGPVAPDACTAADPCVVDHDSEAAAPPLAGTGGVIPWGLVVLACSLMAVGAVLVGRRRWAG